MAEYDNISLQYKEATSTEEGLCRLYVENYTYFKIMGDITGTSILDLACGEGFYTRKFKQKGAAKVVGVDISEKMLELAREEEIQEPLGLEFLQGDVCDLGKIERFDLVVASYLLNHASSKEKLQQMCQSIWENLKPGGRFVSMNNNLEQPPESYRKLNKYGYTKSISAPLAEGTPINVIFINPVDGKKFSVEDYYLSKETYEWAFRSVGFKEIRWHSPIVSPEGIEKFGQEFWQDFIDYPPIIGIECWKS